MWLFLNPMFLSVLAAAAVPLILHLLQRKWVVTIPFSTTRFIKLAQKRTANRVRMENFLLWLLRTLIVMAIAAAFAMPIIRVSSVKDILGTAARDVAIVWDVSYSMSYLSGNNDIWNNSKEIVVSIIEGLESDDKVCLFLADDDVTPLIEQLTGEMKTVLSSVKVLQPRPTSSQLKPALMAAVTALEDSSKQGREREIFIVTDGQKLPWSGFDKGRKEEEPAAASGATNIPAPAKKKLSAFSWNAAKIDKEIAFFAVVLGVTHPDNSAPLNVELQPPLLMVDTPSQLTVKLGHTGPAESISISVTIDELEVGRRSTVVNADSATEIVFALPALLPGVYTGRAEIPMDAVMMDNAFYFMLRVKEKLPVLCAGTIKDAFFLMRALNPSDKVSQIKVERVDPNSMGSKVNVDAYSCIFLCNAVPLSGQSLVALEQYVRRGGLLVLFPGSKGAPADYNAWTCLPALPQAIVNVEQEDQRRTLRLVKQNDLLFSGMKLPPGSLPAIAITREIQWNQLESKAEVIIMTSNNRPFLIRRDFGTGHTLIFSVAADRSWSNFPLSPFFLPITHQIVQYGAKRDNERLFFWARRSINLGEVLTSIQDNIELRNPLNEIVPVHKLKTGKDVIYTADNIYQSGIYSIADVDGKFTPVMAVNAVRTESDLTRIKIKSIPALLKVKKLKVAETKEDLMRLIKEHREGSPLAEPLLWLVFVLALLEFLLANKASKKARTLSEQMVIQSSGRVSSQKTEK